MTGRAAPDRSGAGRSGLLAAFAILACCLLAYANGLHGTFVFDDEISIVLHEDIGTLWPPSVPLTGPHESPSSGRPLVALSLALNYAAGGLNTFGYHVFNLTVHAFVCLALYRLARRLLERSTTTSNRAQGIALAIACLFAVHPIGTSVVTYISQRAESMSALFMLLAWNAWSSHLGRDERRASSGWLAVLCCYLALLCKEIGFAAPLVAALLDRAFFSPTWSTVWRRGRLLYLAMLSSWVVLALSLLTSARGATVTWTYRDYDSWTYLLTSADAITHYARLLFWPHPLVIDYGWPIARSLSDVPWQVPLLTALFAFSVLSLRGRPQAAFLGLSVFLILAPSSSLIPVVTEIMAEHRMYLPGAFVISIVVLLVDRLLGAVRAPRIAAVLLAVIPLAPLLLVTRAQNARYDDAVGMLRHNVKWTPDNYRAHYNLGYQLSRRGEYNEARESLFRAIRIDPSYAPAHRELSYVSIYTGSTSDALEHIDRALALKPDDALNLVAKGAFLAIAGRPQDGMTWLDKALASNPGFPEALKWRVNVLLLAQNGPAADRALADYAPGLSRAQRQRELQTRYRDLQRMVQASDRP